MQPTAQEMIDWLRINFDMKTRGIVYIAILRHLALLVDKKYEDLKDMSEHNILVGTNCNFVRTASRQVIAPIWGLYPGIVLISTTTRQAPGDSGFLVRTAQGFQKILLRDNNPPDITINQWTPSSCRGGQFKMVVFEEWDRNNGSRYCISDAEWALVEPFLNKWLPQE